MDSRTTIKKEKLVKQTSVAKRVTVIRLIMQGYYVIQVAKLLNIHRETISEYVKKFNEVVLTKEKFVKT